MRSAHQRAGGDATPAGGGARGAVPSAAALVPPSPAVNALQRSLEGDDALQRSMGRIRELMGEAQIELPANLFAEILGYVGGQPRPPPRKACA